MKALELDDNLAEPHTALGVVKLFHDWDWAGAERELARAVEINQSSSDAHHMYSYCLMLAGRFDASLAEMMRAQQLDPLSLSKIAGIGEVLYYQRRSDEAINQYQKALEMDPNSGFLHWAMGNVYVHQGKHEAAIAEYKKAIPLSGNSPDEPASLGYAYALAGKKQNAQDIIDDLKARSRRSYISPALIAFVYVGLGEKDQAFVWLEKAFEGRDILLAYLKVEPMFDALRTDPRFTNLLQRTGLDR
jgi:tetratricopeptide (TPR) repeat protein